MAPIVLDRPAETIWAALERPGIVRWDTRLMDRVCAVDIDYHHYQCSDNRLVMDAIRPYARLLWNTKNGARAICFADMIFNEETPISASELGACAAFAAYRACPDAIANIELKTDTRTYTEIGATPEIRRFQLEAAQNNFLYYREGLSNLSLTPDEISDWLEANGYGPIGARHSHDLCPINPHHTSGTDPVAITESGIRCYRCDAIHDDGFRSFATLIQGAAAPANTYWVRNLCRNFTHWGHSKYVWKHYVQNMRDSHIKLLNSGGMKLACRDECLWPLIERAMQQTDMPRTGSLWLNTDFSIPTGKGQSERVKGLPACQFLNEENRLSVSNKRHYVLMGNDSHELAKLGYYPIRPVGYCDFGRCVRQDASCIIAETGEFRYIETGFRKSRIDHWQYLFDSFPSIDPLYIKILFFSSAYSQAGQGEPPQVICVGPSGAGKTQTTEIYCHIVKGKNAYLTPSKEIEKVLQEIVDNQTATLFTQDETFKTISDPVEYIKYMNRIKPGAIARKLYVGMVTIDNVPPIITTDVTLPDIFKMNEQISRRSVLINLQNKTPDWRETSGGIDSWNRCPLTNLMRENLVSEMLDLIEEFWHSGLNTFMKCARELGAGIGTENADSELSDSIGKLWDAYKNCPPHETSRYPAALGWRQGIVKGAAETYGNGPQENLGNFLKNLILDLTGEQIHDIMNNGLVTRLTDAIHAKKWRIGDKDYKVEVRIMKRQCFVRFS